LIRKRLCSCCCHAERNILNLELINDGSDALLVFRSQPGWSYRIQASEDLVTWTNLAALTGTGRWMRRIETNAVNFSRFWRLEIQEGGFNL
jgi:hypothetical protein